jgi:hypothetical protein
VNSRPLHRNIQRRAAPPHAGYAERRAGYADRREQAMPIGRERPCGMPGGSLVGWWDTRARTAAGISLLGYCCTSSQQNVMGS